MSMLADPRRKQKISVDPRNLRWKNDENKIGLKLMEKMGWTSGKGLGANEEGNIDPIKVTLKSDQRGVGCTRNHADNWIAHQDDFNSLLANLNSNNTEEGAASDPEPAGRVLSLEHKSKTSKGRVHYMKFAKGKDLSCKSAQDLDCVFGRRKSKSAPSTPNNVSEANSEEESDEPKQKSKFDSDVNTFDSGTSVQDYFAKKMAALKESRSAGSAPVQIETIKDESEDEDVRPGFGFSNSSKAQRDYRMNFVPATKESEATELDPSPVLENEESNDSTKKEKKKKKKKNKEIEEMVECDMEERTEELNVAVPKKKSKKKKKDKIETEIINMNEESNVDSYGSSEKKKEKKTKKKNKDIDLSQENSSDANDSKIQPGNEEKPKKKKRKRDNEDGDPVGEDNEIESPVTPKKKSKKLNTEELSGNSDSTGQVPKGKKKKKSKTKDRETSATSEEHDKDSTEVSTERISKYKENRKAAAGILEEMTKGSKSTGQKVDARSAVKWEETDMAKHLGNEGDLGFAGSNIHKIKGYGHEFGVDKTVRYTTKICKKNEEVISNNNLKPK